MQGTDRCAICNVELDDDDTTICGCCIADEAYREYQEYLDNADDDD